MWEVKVDIRGKSHLEKTAFDALSKIDRHQRALPANFGRNRTSPNRRRWKFGPGERRWAGICTKPAAVCYICIA